MHPENLQPAINGSIQFDSFGSPNLSIGSTQTNSFDNSRAAIKDTLLTPNSTLDLSSPLTSDQQKTVSRTDLRTDEMQELFFTDPYSELDKTTSLRPLNARPLVFDLNQTENSATRKSSITDANPVTDASSKPVEISDPAIPQKPAASETYQVKTGDTLWSIARHALIDSGTTNPTPHDTKFELQRIISANPDQVSSFGKNAQHIVAGMRLEMPLSTIDAPTSSDNLTMYNSQSKIDVSAVDRLTCDDKNHQPHHQIDKHQSDKHPSERHGHHLWRDLHNLEKRVVAFTRTAIDDLHHWLDRTAAKAFLVAKHEAEAHGIHIQISSAGRTFSDQSRLYRQLHGHSPVAIPGTSNHETGLAIDIQNWRQAKPYLLAHGFVHGDGNGALKNDPWHFKYVG